MQWLGIPSLSMRFWVQVTSIHISKVRSPNNDLYATWSHILSMSWQKEKRESPIKFFQEGGSWGHDFLKEVGPITQETVYHPWNMYTTLTSNLHEMTTLYFPRLPVDTCAWVSSFHTLI